MMPAGPSIAGILLTALVYGKTELRSRLLKRRVGARWYAAALLIAPGLMTALLLGLSLSSREFLPGIIVSADKTLSVLSGFAIALGAGIFEELGWTGFAIVELAGAWFQNNKVSPTCEAVALTCSKRKQDIYYFPLPWIAGFNRAAIR